MNDTYIDYILDLLPQIEAFRMPDTYPEKAYDAVPANFRAYLKTGIALAHFYFSKTTQKETKIRDAHAGFCSFLVQKPVDWTAIIFEQNYAAAARICAAAILPRLCDAREVFAICVGEKPHNSALLPLELCGIEDLFCGSHPEITNIIDNLVSVSRENNFSGRIILLHDGSLLALGEKIRNLSLPLFEESKPPALFVANPESFSKEILYFCHGIYPERQKSPDSRFDAIFASAEECTKMTAFDRDLPVPLIIAPGCEGFWKFQQLDIEFFMSTSSIVSFIK